MFHSHLHTKDFGYQEKKKKTHEIYRHCWKLKFVSRRKDKEGLIVCCFCDANIKGIKFVF